MPRFKPTVSLWVNLTECILPFNSYTEVTALRAKLAEVEQRLSSQEKLLMRRAMQEYNTLVANLFSTSFAVKAQYEKYR